MVGKEKRKHVKTSSVITAPGTGSSKDAEQGGESRIAALVSQTCCNFGNYFKQTSLDFLCTQLSFAMEFLYYYFVAKAFLFFIYY